MLGPASPARTARPSVIPGDESIFCNRLVVCLIEINESSREFDPLSPTSEQRFQGFDSVELVLIGAHGVSLYGA